jgi:hypothetical protein
MLKVAWPQDPTSGRSTASINLRLSFFSTNDSLPALFVKVRGSRLVSEDFKIKFSWDLTERND